MTTNTNVDRTDLAILRLLTKDARLSNKEIAAAVGLAPSSCHERLRTLREKEILLGSHAEINFTSIGLALEALLFVQLAKLDTQKVDEFVRRTAKVRQVRTVFLVSGRFDLIVHVAVRDMGQLKRVISDNLNCHPCVIRVETSVIFNRETQHEIPIEEAEV
jgi:DNA-binding Lrp family transcriptional regulator